MAKFTHRTAHSFGFHRIGGHAQSRGINQVERQAIQMDMLAQHVARGSGLIGHDGDLLADQPVEQARFPGIRLARDDHVQSLAQ